MRWSLVVAALLVTAISLVPELGPIGHVLRLFATFVHEFCHAAAAWGTGGSVDDFVLNLDTSGHVLTRGGWEILISSAGYVGTTVVGALVLLLRDREQLVAAGFCFASLVMGFVALLGGSPLAAGASLVYLAVFYWALTQEQVALLIVPFIGVLLLVDSLNSLRDLWVINSTSATVTDASNLAASTGVPAALWTILWLAISATITLWTVLRLLRSK